LAAIMVPFDNLHRLEAGGLQAESKPAGAGEQLNGFHGLFLGHFFPRLLTPLCAVTISFTARRTSQETETSSLVARSFRAARTSSTSVTVMRSLLRGLLGRAILDVYCIT